MSLFSKDNIFSEVAKAQKNMCVSGYMEFLNSDGRSENIFILLKVCIWR